MSVRSCVYLPSREVHSFRKVRSFLNNKNLHIMIYDGADTKQKQLIKISAILALSHEAIKLKHINLAFCITMSNEVLSDSCDIGVIEDLTFIYPCITSTSISLFIYFFLTPMRLMSFIYIYIWSTHC